jgi:hypothetical protein
MTDPKILISATISQEAWAIRSRWGERQKSEGVTEAIIFYNEHGPNNLKGLWRVNEELRKNYAGLEKHLQALTAEIDRLTL